MEWEGSRSDSGVGMAWNKYVGVAGSDVGVVRKWFLLCWWYGVALIGMMMCQLEFK